MSVRSALEAGPEGRREGGENVKGESGRGSGSRRGEKYQGGGLAVVVAQERLHASSVSTSTCSDLILSLSFSRLSDPSSSFSFFRSSSRRFSSARNRFVSSSLSCAFFSVVAVVDRRGETSVISTPSSIQMCMLCVQTEDQTKLS